MPRQRSKKPSQSKTVLQKTAKLDQDDSDIDIDIESDLSEKDEEEEELDRLVLGDGFGFKARLGRSAVQEEDVESGEEVIEDGDEADIENVEDADVITTSLVYE